MKPLSVNREEPHPPAAPPESKERQVIFLLCLLAAVHVFVFSAGFPLINNVDEQAHFDLAVKYSHGHLPRSLDPISQEALQYIVIFGSQEYLWSPKTFPEGRFPPPPWTQPMQEAAPVLLAREAAWQSANHESSQPPLYYALAGLWWHVGKACGIEGGRLLYWLRFLNMLFVMALVWVGYAAARMVFPGPGFRRIGVAALLALLPQSAFYSIESDVLSPLGFGAVFICAVQWLRADVPDVRLGIFTGVAFAATFLVKMTNLPLLFVAGMVVSLKMWRLAGNGKLRAALPALAAAFACALPPMLLWMIWCKYHFGDFTGSGAKVAFLGWTVKPSAEWLHHPIFTPHGLWTFVSGLLATFWQGEFMWHREPLAAATVSMIYVIASLGLVGLASVALVSKRTTANPIQRSALGFGLGSCVAAVAFLGFLSIIYDYHDCFRPSRDLPYFTSGRMILGALIPFLLLFVYGLDRALSFTGSRWPRWLALTGIALFMLISEIAIDRPVFSSQYNWFHM